MARLLIEDGSGVPGLPRGVAILGQGDARELLMQAGDLRDPKQARLLQEAAGLLKNGLVADPRRLPRSTALARFEPEVLAWVPVMPAMTARFRRMCRTALIESRPVSTVLCRVI